MTEFRGRDLMSTVAAATLRGPAQPHCKAASECQGLTQQILRLEGLIDNAASDVEALARDIEKAAQDVSRAGDEIARALVAALLSLAFSLFLLYRRYRKLMELLEALRSGDRDARAIMSAIAGIIGVDLAFDLYGAITDRSEDQKGLEDLRRKLQKVERYRDDLMMESQRLANMWMSADCGRQEPNLPNPLSMPSS